VLRNSAYFFLRELWCTDFKSEVMEIKVIGIFDQYEGGKEGGSLLVLVGKIGSWCSIGRNLSLTPTPLPVEGTLRRVKSRISGGSRKEVLKE